MLTKAKHDTMTPFKNFTISPGSWVICNEAVCHQYERQISPWDVLHWHHCCQPHPSVPLLKVDCIQEIKQRSSEFSNHAESQKRFSSKVITPTSDVEGEEDRNEMLRPWANGIKAHHLSKTRSQRSKILAIVGSKIFGVCGWVVNNWLTIGCKIGFKIDCKIGCKKIYWQVFKKKILTNFKKKYIDK